MRSDLNLRTLSSTEQAKARHETKMAARGGPSRNRTPTAKAREQMAADDAANQVQLAIEGTRTAMEAQYKPLIEFLTTHIAEIKKVMEEQRGLAAKHIELLIKEREEQKGNAVEQVEALTRAFKEQMEVLKSEMTTMLQAQGTGIQIPTGASPSYAEIARTPPNSHPSNLSSGTSRVTTPSTITDTLYCTIDTSRVGEEHTEKTHPRAIREAIEQEMRANEGMETWRCAAVTKDMRSSTRIRVACRNEEELNKVKEASEKTLVTGTRILRDQLYPVKVDNANRKAVLEIDGSLRADAAERLGKENEVKISKIAWISKKDNGKDYGSMIIYVTRGSEAARLLRGQYFNLEGESAFTRVCEPRTGPTQCYNCQAMGHKAFSCKKPQICGKCAKEGHHHSECLEEIPKCVPCGGPHESYSKNCRITHPIHV